jgi:AcrR family transcriptional regulator
MNKSASRQNYHHGALAAAIVERARAVLQETGPDELSLRSIARDLGVSHQAPYRHFANREALLEALAVEGFQALIESLEGALRSAGTDVHARFMAAGMAYVDFASANPAEYELMLGRPINDASLSAAAAQQAFRILVGIVEQGQAEGRYRTESARRLATGAWSMVHGIATLMNNRALGVPESERAEFVRDIVRSAERGVMLR